MRAGLPDAIGVGIYSAKDVARLVGTKPQTVRRWFGMSKNARPLWEPQHSRANGELALGFLDMLETRLVHELRHNAVSLQTIRTCIQRAKHVTQEAHPFATQRIKTDGRRLFLEIGKDTDDPHLLDLLNSQWAFQNVIEQSLRNVAFDASGLAERWHPLGKASVVLDPKRNFGAATLSRTGVPTSAIAGTFEVEQSVSMVADLFNVTEDEVRDALEFEQRYSG